MEFSQKRMSLQIIKLHINGMLNSAINIGVKTKKPENFHFQASLVAGAVELPRI